MSKKNFRITLGATLLLLGVASILFYLFPLKPQEISRAEFQEWMAAGAIVSAKATPTQYAGIYLVEGTHAAEGRETKFNVITHLDESQTRTLFETGAVKIEIPGRGMRTHLLNLAPTLIIAALIVGLLVYHFSFGKSRKHHKVKHRPDTRFKDVAGVEEAKGEVQEVVDFLRNPKKYKTLGARLPKGILLIGPPGTGKTMLAKAIAGEADANFFSTHGSDFNEIFVGVGAKRIRELFRAAKKHRPAIIFIDEIDCLAKNRKMDTNGEAQQTNNALLAEMDGFEAAEGIIVVAATNRPEDLDNALLRPGRFDRKVFVPLPDMRGRRAILAAHTVESPIENKEKNLDLIAQTTTEMSGADLASVINEAAILCAKDGRFEITLSDLEESRDKVRWGKERKSMVLRKEEREMVAYHEAGHTIININKCLLPPLYKVSIIPRGQALGVTTLMPSEDQNIHSKAFFLQHLVVLMGGRAAERVFYGTTTNGAGGDLHSARSIARKMIHEWGMGERLYYEPEHYDAELEINRLIEAADKEALEMIQREKHNADKLARALLKFETLSREQVMNLLYEDAPPEAVLVAEHN